MNQDCIARMWNYLCCPACDFMWNARGHLEQPGAGVALAAAPDAPSDADDPSKLPTVNEAFEALDKFIDQVKSIPGVAGNADIMPQLATLIGTKATLMTALAEAAVHIRAHQDQVAGFVQAANERGEAHRKKMEEVNKPSEPLDGVALGRALLKNLGFTN